MASPLTVPIWKDGATGPDGQRLLNPVRKHRWSWFFYCPLCSQRFLDSRFRVPAYTMHYCGVHLGIKVFRGLGDG